MRESIWEKIKYSVQMGLQIYIFYFLIYKGENFFLYFWVIQLYFILYLFEVREKVLWFRVDICFIVQFKFEVSERKFLEGEDLKYV